ncbi:MAG: hypothetical protein A8274_561 [Halanaerobium sp. 4-GBenrich]|jgi:hypothetical protein|uniref:DUF4359 domain-containing protein n=2 Tax=Halanaerobium TaxID=2330 RepID=A0A1G6T9Q6_9FIRM|nr:hypothetical protein [Halanaerobium]ODS50472.1 MAG: hypothetical protein A8274_561 [Halanaerobium sp. 4-GBenrich]PTV93288.1 hypothetical protein C8C76_1442 [Halanaerobium saccharolyticum]TDS27745.1 hypothetical protein BY453_12532 [Halanaerobium congolense]SDD25306.1 hypothetical protein SAMN04488597_13911 [Halanaerobium congolense]
MKNVLISLVIILVLLVGAAVTNPSREEFINWGVAEIRAEAESDLERIFGGAVAAPMLELQTEVDDYVFFSIFTLQKSESEVKYLGVFNNIFSLGEN